MCKVLALESINVMKNLFAARRKIMMNSEPLLIIRYDAPSYVTNEKVFWALAAVGRYVMAWLPLLDPQRDLPSRPLQGDAT